LRHLETSDVKLVELLDRPENSDIKILSELDAESHKIFSTPPTVLQVNKQIFLINFEYSKKTFLGELFSNAQFRQSIDFVRGQHASPFPPQTGPDSAAADCALHALSRSNYRASTEKGRCYFYQTLL